MTDDADDRRNLVAALVRAIPGSRDAAWKAYNDDPEFHALVRVLADLWVELSPTLIEKSRDRQTKIALAVALARTRLHEGILDPVSIDQVREFIDQQAPPPAPHYIQVRRTKAPPRGRGYIHIHVEHPEHCRRQPHDGRVLGRFNCDTERAAEHIKKAMDPELGRFIVDGIEDGALVITKVEPPPGHTIDVSYGSQRAFTELIHPAACAGPGRCALEDASMPSPLPSEGRYFIDGVEPDGVLILSGWHPTPASPTSGPVTYPTEDER